MTDAPPNAPGAPPVGAPAAQAPAPAAVPLAQQGADPQNLNRNPAADTQRATGSKEVKRPGVITNAVPVVDPDAPLAPPEKVDEKKLPLTTQMEMQAGRDNLSNKAPAPHASLK